MDRPAISTLDDAAFEHPTKNLVPPHSIYMLEVGEDDAAQLAPEMVQNENDHALTDRNRLHPEPSSGPHADLTRSLRDDTMIQSILANAKDLKEYQEFLHYKFYIRDSEGSGNESVPADDSDEELDEDAVDDVITEYDGRNFDQCQVAAD